MILRLLGSHLKFHGALQSETGAFAMQYVQHFNRELLSQSRVIISVMLIYICDNGLSEHLVSHGTLQHLCRVCSNTLFYFFSRKWFLFLAKSFHPTARSSIDLGYVAVHHFS
jgi:hypothetical protein